MSNNSQPHAIHSPVIACRNVWKIFGRNAREALAAIRAQALDKTEVLKRYGCVVGVADVSFEVGKGEIFCIMGLSGSGKSTLIRHINRLIDPTDGQILIEGQEISALKPAQMRALRSQKVGMVFQSVALLPYRTVIDNVALGLEFRRMPKAERLERARAALATVHLSDWANRYPAELSGGMMQRVGLARALANDPAILLMDEPFSALDPLIRRELQEQFLELSRRLNKTTVFITHDLEEAIRIGSRIAVMRDGMLIQTGTPEEIVLRPADDYIARFTAGLARNHLVTARSVMVAPAAFAAASAADPAAAPRVSPEADIDEIIDLLLAHDVDHAAVAEGDTIVGVVTQPNLLRGIQGRPIPDAPQAAG